MKSVPGLPLAHSGVKCIAFADDVAILESKGFEMEGYLNKIDNYEIENHLQVNVEKLMIFGRNNIERDFVYKGKPMETVDKFKYLGVWLTPNLSFKVAIEESRLKLARITGMIPSLPQILR